MVNPKLIIDVLVRNRIEPLLDMTPPKRYSSVQQQLDAALQWGLRDTPDLVSYCTLAMLHGEGFESQSPWSSLLPAVRRTECNLRQAIAIAEKGNHESQ